MCFATGLLPGGAVLAAAQAAAAWLATAPLLTENADGAHRRWTSVRFLFRSLVAARKQPFLDLYSCQPCLAAISHHFSWQQLHIPCHPAGAYSYRHVVALTQDMQFRRP